MEIAFVIINFGRMSFLIVWWCNSISCIFSEKIAKDIQSQIKQKKKIIHNFTKTKQGVNKGERGPKIGHKWWESGLFFITLRLLFPLFLSDNLACRTWCDSLRARTKCRVIIWVHRLQTSVNQLLPAVLSLPFPWGEQTDRDGTQKRRDQGLQRNVNMFACSLVSLGPRLLGLGHQAVCSGCLIAFLRTAKRDDSDHLKSSSETLWCAYKLY